MQLCLEPIAARSYRFNRSATWPRPVNFDRLAGPLVIPQVPAAHSFEGVLMPASFREQRANSKKPEIKCNACEGRGFEAIRQPQPRKSIGRKIYPAKCAKCAGKGRLRID